MGLRDATLAHLPEKPESSVDLTPKRSKILGRPNQTNPTELQGLASRPLRDRDVRAREGKRSVTTAKIVRASRSGNKFTDQAPEVRWVDFLTAQSTKSPRSHQKTAQYKIKSCRGLIRKIENPLKLFVPLFPSWSVGERGVRDSTDHPFPTTFDQTGKSTEKEWSVLDEPLLRGINSITFVEVIATSDLPGLLIHKMELKPAKFFSILKKRSQEGKSQNAHESTRMARESSFAVMMAQLRNGDQEAASAVFAKFLQRLIALASSQFNSRLRDKADPEDVIQSVYLSFFKRMETAPYELADWGGLWALLATITIRKCHDRRRFWRASKRNDLVEVAAFHDHEGNAWWEAVDRSPTPLQAMILEETLEQVIAQQKPLQRRIAELTFQGYTGVEIARRCQCAERTVYREVKWIREQLTAMVEVDNFDGSL